MKPTQAREMAPLLLERTGGNPLFMTSIVRELAQQHVVTPGAVASIPHDVRHFIERQIDDLGESDRTLLMAASVIGREFATAAVAAALESEIDAVEASCARLARQGVFISKQRRPRGRMAPPQTSTRFGTISIASCCTTACRRHGAQRAMSASAAGSKPPGASGSTRLRRSWRNISSAATSRYTRSRITNAPPPKRSAGAPMPRRSAICAARSMGSGTSPMRSNAPGSRSSCASRWAPHS